MADVFLFRGKVNYLCLVVGHRMFIVRSFGRCLFCLFVDSNLDTTLLIMVFGFNTSISWEVLNTSKSGNRKS